MTEKVCVAGSGTMGRGIALAAALNNYPVVLFDNNETVLEKAKEAIEKDLKFLVDKNKIDEEKRKRVSNGIRFSAELSDCVADLIIEAIIENVDAKTSLFAGLSELNSKKTIFASNTSSLSINELQQNIKNPERVAGLHFFNPAQVMKLVEVVQGKHTSKEVIDELIAFCSRLNKTAVLCKDSPGFIVNRVARHYYLEAMRIVEKNISVFGDIDAIMESTGFKMGPFRLMDLIGMDINLAVSQSIYQAFEKNPRFMPSPIQVEKVEKGELGKKSGKGFYNYI